MGYHQSIARSRNYLAIDARAHDSPPSPLPPRSPVASLAPSRSTTAASPASTSVDAYLSTYLPISHFGRCTVSTYSSRPPPPRPHATPQPRARALSRNAKSTTPAYRPARDPARGCEHLFESLARHPEMQIRENEGDSSPTSTGLLFFLRSFIWSGTEAPGRLNPPEDSPAISRRPSATSFDDVPELCVSVGSFQVFLIFFLSLSFSFSLALSDNFPTFVFKLRTVLT